MPSIKSKLNTLLDIQNGQAKILKGYNKVGDAQKYYEHISRLNNYYRVKYNDILPKILYAGFASKIYKLKLFIAKMPYCSESIYNMSNAIYNKYDKLMLRDVNDVSELDDMIAADIKLMNDAIDIHNKSVNINYTKCAFKLVK